MFAELPIIEVAPESLVTNEERTSVSLTCIATGAPFLEIAWVKGERNLTKQAPTHYSINSTVINGGEKVLSMLTIHRPTYTDSGTYTCIATIMNGGRDGERFKVQESADLTILGKYPTHYFILYSIVHCISTILILMVIDSVIQY